MKNPLRPVMNKASSKIKQSAQKFYETATPKVQEKIDAFVSQKSTDIIEKVSNAACIGTIIFLVVHSVNGSSRNGSDTLDRAINIAFDEVNITYNYYGKEDH